MHAWERFVASRGGLDIEKDVRIAPMDPPGMLAAMETKSIDGFATSLPFTTEAVVKGKAIMLASGARDAPDLLPFAYGLIYTRPDMCTKQREKCVRIANALAAANKFILEKPDEALELLKKRFDKMDQEVLAAAWKTVSQAHAKDLRVTVPGLEHSQQVSLEAKLLESEGRAEELRRAVHRRVHSLKFAPAFLAPTSEEGRMQARAGLKRAGRGRPV